MFITITSLFREVQKCYSSSTSRAMYHLPMGFIPPKTGLLP